MKRKVVWLAISGLIVAVLMLGSCTPTATPTPTSTPEIELRLRLQQGETYTLRVTAEQKISQTSKELPLDMTQTIAIGFSYSVSEVEADGTASGKVIYQSVLYKMDGPLGKMEYDSSNPPADVSPMLRVFAALVGEGFLMKISPDGRIKDIQGADVMMENVLKRLEVPAGATRDAIEKQIQEQLGSQALKEKIENVMAIYPDKRVRIGDSWARRVVTSLGFPMVIEHTLILNADKDDVATVGVRSVVKPNPEAGPITIGTWRLKFSASGEQEGTIDLRETTGWPIRGKLSQRFSGQITAVDVPVIPKGTTWPISGESIVSFETF